MSPSIDEILESRGHEFVATAPGWKPVKQNLLKFKKDMKIFLSSSHGDRKFALVAVKMLSDVIKKPIALMIVMPGLPFNEHCGPFLIGPQAVFDNLTNCTDPQVLMYEPLAGDWTVFERTRSIFKRKSSLPDDDRKKKRVKRGHELGRGDSSLTTLAKYNISPNFFAFQSSFRQLLLWVLHTDEVYRESKSKRSR